MKMTPIGSIHETDAKSGINISLNFYLVPEFGILGASIASGSSLIFLVITGLYSVWKLLGFHPYDRQYFKIMLSSVISIACVWSWTRLALFNGFLQLFIVTLISCTTFFLILWLFGFNDDDRIFIALVKKRLRRK